MSASCSLPPVALGRSGVDLEQAPGDSRGSKPPGISWENFRAACTPCIPTSRKNIARDGRSCSTKSGSCGPGDPATENGIKFALKLLSPAPSKRAGHLILKLGNKQFEFPDAVRPLCTDLGYAILRAEVVSRLDRTRALHALLGQFEEAYHQGVRDAGRLTFLDVTGLLAAAGNGTWGGRSLQRIDRRAIDYRLDATYDHWLLDEFQDTSRLQWNALRDLVDEVLQSESGRRSFFYVGDTKQAIYGWRGGDPRLFTEIADFHNSADEPRIDTGEELATVVPALCRRSLTG